MENEKNIIEVTDNTVDETAYLVVSSKHIGVTNAPEDILAYVNNELEQGGGIYIAKGFKDDLLAAEQKLLIIDNVHSSDGNTLIVPHRQQDYNLIERNINAKPLLQVIDIVKKP